jgi:histidine ammonia-lyase
MSVILDGNSLSIEQFAKIARDPSTKVEAAADSWLRVEKCRKVIDDVVESYRQAAPQDRDQFAVYGVTTGFGEFKNVRLEPSQLLVLQENILKSHAIGFGENEDPDDPANYFPAEVVRATLVQRINTFLKGHSGVRRELVELLIKMVNAGIVPLAPTRGSVGSSGDLCPLAHTFATLLGFGHYFVVNSADDVKRGLSSCKKKPAAEMLKELKVLSFQLKEKEGIALTNGAAYSSAMLALAVFDAETLADTADAAVAITLEAIGGRTRAFLPLVHQARGMAGQIQSAKNILQLVKGSQIIGLTNDVQDVYSVRCAPQVHGASRDAIAYARKVVEAEINAATDNPLFFPGETPDDSGGDSNDPQCNHEPRAYSAGNFHGQPIGMAADFLAIAVAELANISERRTQMMLDANHNRNLPANLVANGGVNSGLMLAQYTAASVVSENKILCHPSSVDSIPTSANIEDHVAMATTAARKVMQVLNNTRAVLALELMTAAQAVEWRVCEGGDSIAIAKRISTRPPDVADKQAHARQREELFKKRYEGKSASGRGELMAMLGAGTRQVYVSIRSRVAPLIEDRYLEPDFRAMRELVAAWAIANCLTKNH